MIEVNKREDIREEMERAMEAKRAAELDLRKEAGNLFEAIKAYLREKGYFKE